ncbi:MAG: hypothetical protein ABSB66_03195 [Candidatus Acidiferrales bacterium]
MLIESAKNKRLIWMRLIRRALDYGLTVGAALLCSYWIVQGRW